MLDLGLNVTKVLDATATAMLIMMMTIITIRMYVAQMKKLKEIQEDIHSNITKKHKKLKQRLTEDALEDQLQ